MKILENSCLLKVRAAVPEKADFGLETSLEFVYVMCNPECDHRTCNALVKRPVCVERVPSGRALLDAKQ